MKPQKKFIVLKPKSIQEAINDLEEFLECDLFSKFRPNQIITGKRGKLETFYRKDMFANEKDFIEYLRRHFDILEKEIIRLMGKRKYMEKKING